MDQQKQQLVEKLKSANNILVTVRTNPTVDALSAAIGLTLLLNKQGKHATAVYSGETPSTIEFLKPEATLEKNTDSLRDFIIALDKSKADKLRYKVEDKVVKIFITPYRTSITEDDLNFSQGDFNVDAVVAIGVHDQADLDGAVTAHGRILHDAVVMSLNNTTDGKLGAINWQDVQASSLSELVAELVKELDTDKDKPLLDEQIATALLTGIVAETDRFSNEKTTSVTMGHSADLMKAGANQQLVATKLQEALSPPPTPTPTPGPTPEGSASPVVPPDMPTHKRDDGTLEIAHERPHDSPAPPPGPNPIAPPAPAQEPDTPPAVPEPPHISAVHATRVDEPAAHDADTPHPELPPVPAAPDNRTVVTQPPSMGGMLTANSEPESYDPITDPLSAPAPNEPLLSHEGPAEPASQKPDVSPAMPPQPQPESKHKLKFKNHPKPELKPEPKPEPAPQPDTKVSPEPKPAASDASATQPADTLASLEDAVHKDEADQSQTASPDLDSARDEVLKALSETPEQTEPAAALNAQPLGGELHPNTDSPAAAAPSTELEIDADGNIRTSESAMLPPAGNEAAPNAGSPADQPMDMPLPPSLDIPEPSLAPPSENKPERPDAPPQVPPPFMPSNFGK